MQSLKTDSFLEFNPDTLQSLRQQYNFDKPGKIEEAIDLLEEWIKKQPHFKKKDFRKFTIFYADILFLSHLVLIYVCYCLNFVQFKLNFYKLLLTCDFFQQGII